MSGTTRTGPLFEHSNGLCLPFLERRPALKATGASKAYLSQDKMMQNYFVPSKWQENPQYMGHDKSSPQLSEITTYTRLSVV
jgi:hypothetical protein